MTGPGPGTGTIGDLIVFPWSVGLVVVYLSMFGGYETSETVYLSRELCEDSMDLGKEGEREGR